MSLSRSTGTFFGANKNNASTTVTTGTNSATQTLGATAGMSVGDSLYFATAAVYRFIQSITSGTVVVLTASVNSTTGETVTRSLNNNATMTSAVIDLLGNTTSVGDILVYADITSTVTAGTIDIYVEPQETSGSAYTIPGNSTQGGTSGNPTLSITPINGTQAVYIGRFQPDRYCTATICNNATGAAVTVSLNYTLEQLS